MIWLHTTPVAQLKEKVCPDCCWYTESLLSILAELISISLISILEIHDMQMQSFSNLKLAISAIAIFWQYCTLRAFRFMPWKVSPLFKQMYSKSNPDRCGLSQRWAVYMTLPTQAGNQLIYITSQPELIQTQPLYLIHPNKQNELQIAFWSKRLITFITTSTPKIKDRP